MNRIFGSLNSTSVDVTSISTELVDSKRSGIIGPIKNGDAVYIARYGGVTIDFVPTFLSLLTQKCLGGNDDMLIPSGNFSGSSNLDDVPQYTITSNKDPITGSTTISFKNNDIDIRWIKARNIPKSSNWFENVWKDFNDGKIVQ